MKKSEVMNPEADYDDEVDEEEHEDGSEASASTIGPDYLKMQFQQLSTRKGGLREYEQQIQIQNNTWVKFQDLL